MDRPDKCQWCSQGPHGASVKTASNGRLYVGKLNVIGTKPDGTYGEYQADYWYDRKGKALYEAGPMIYKKPTPKQIEAGLAEGLEKKDIRGDKIKLRIETEVCAITNVGTDKIPLYLCIYCRSIFKAKQARLNAKPDATEPMFDNLAEIDAKGKAMKEKKKQERRDMNKPITSGYENEAL